MVKSGKTVQIKKCNYTEEGRPNCSGRWYLVMAHIYTKYMNNKYTCWNRWQNESKIIVKYGSKVMYHLVTDNKIMTMIKY